MSRVAQTWIPLCNEQLSRLQAQLAKLEQAIVFLRDRHLDERADQVEYEHEMLLRIAEAPNRLPILTLPQGYGGLVCIPTPNDDDIAAWLGCSSAPLEPTTRTVIIRADHSAAVTDTIEQIQQFHQLRREHADQATLGYVDPDTTINLDQIRKTL